MASRLKLIIAYNGAPFSGWQSQASGNTVQDHLEKALAQVLRKRVRLHAAGRTDAGVHALGQCAHVDLPERSLTSERWRDALNAQLPRSIRILRARFVTARFHARFSAKGKVYLYRIWNGEVLPPFEAKRAWHIVAPLDFAGLAGAAQTFVGTHDFAGFAANRGNPPETTARTISAIRVRRRGKCIGIEIHGEGFLYKMVRLMVGALVRPGLGKSPTEEISKRLASRQYAKNATRFVAPADGLFLVRVRY